MKRLPLVVVLIASVAAAQVPETCDQPRTLDKYQLLRRLSLDLRGRAPTYAEYQALDGVETVPETTISTYLASAEYRRTMRRYHEDMFWPNISNLDINSNSAKVNIENLAPKGAAANVLVSAGKGRRQNWRGDPEAITTLHGKQCGNYEQTHFDPAYPGQFRPDPAFVYTEVQNGLTVSQEGWRLVKPYWDPASTVKICAFEAQETLTTNSGAESCGSVGGQGKHECGCGPGLQFCFGPRKIVEALVVDSMREQLGRAVDSVASGKPYTDLLLSTKADQNGPIVAWKRYLSQNYALNSLYAPADADEEIGEVAFTEANTWVSTDRGPLHAGVLTLPVYLLRFQTNRSRANRFRTDFECEPFVPPADLETPAEGCSETGTDLTGRCTCRYCHRILEPLAAHWGQFAEAGTTVLDAAQFPRMKSNCVKADATGICKRFYVNAPGSDNAGSLLAYQYADANHPAISAALAGGPRKRANEIIANGTFAKCTVKRIFANYVKREMRVSSPDLEELDTLNSLAADFSTHNYDLNWLVTQVVSLPQYRSLR